MLENIEIVTTAIFIMVIFDTIFSFFMMTILYDVLKGDTKKYDEEKEKNNDI